jgi:hypothetical protein
MLHQRYPHLLPTSVIQGYQRSLLNNITLLVHHIWQGLGQLIWSLDGHAKVAKVAKVFRMYIKPRIF